MLGDVWVQIPQSYCFWVIRAWECDASLPSQSILSSPKHGKKVKKLVNTGNSKNLPTDIVHMYSNETDFQQITLNNSPPTSKLFLANSSCWKTNDSNILRCRSLALRFLSLNFILSASLRSWSGLNCCFGHKRSRQAITSFLKVDDFDHTSFEKSLEIVEGIRKDVLPAGVVQHHDTR